MLKTKYKYKPLYQIVNKSMFNQQVITIPSELARDFEAGERISLTKSRNVKIIWGAVKNGVYDANFGYREERQLSLIINLDGAMI